MSSTDHSRLPERIDGSDGLLLRLWRVSDAEALARAVAESYEHLHPWMAWTAMEPMPIEQRRAQIARWRQEFNHDGGAVYGVFVHDQIAGGCGLHRRGGEGGLEIGYWIHPRFARQGWATRAAALLTEAALALPDITHVEIHHDRANRASGGVPRKLGFALVEEVPREAAAPADTGIDCRWRIDEESWRRGTGE